MRKELVNKYSVNAAKRRTGVFAHSLVHIVRRSCVHTHTFANNLRKSTHTHTHTQFALCDDGIECVAQLSLDLLQNPCLNLMCANSRLGGYRTCDYYLSITFIQVFVCCRTPHSRIYELSLFVLHLFAKARSPLGCAHVKWI